MHDPRLRLTLLGVLFASTLAAGLTSGCGTKWSYDHADWLIAREVDDLADLDGAQEEWLAKRLDAHHRWHRAEELPAYAAFLEGMADRVGDGLSGEDYGWMRETTAARYRVLVDRLVDDVVALFTTLRPEQLDELAEELAERREDAEEELDRPAAKRLDDRQDKVVDFIEGWTGSLSDAQETEVRRLVAALPDTERADAADRHERQERFLILARAKDAPALRAALVRWFVEEPAARERARRARSEATWLAVDALLTAEQRTHAQEELREMAADLRALHADR